MPAKRILFTTDLSPFSDDAFPLATSVARDRSSELIILHVLELPKAYAPGEWTFFPLEPDIEVIKQMLDNVKPTDPSVPCTHRMVSGDPATEIVRVAAEEDVDMIVMSTHGRTGLPRVLMGSVTEAVVRRAPCPVVTFKRRHEGK